jgi:hypothetical protein
MNRLNEQSSTLTGFQSRDYMRGMPFYGQKGDFNFVTGRSQFTPGVSIKQVALSDMSRSGDPGISEFDRNINIIKYHYKPGDKVRGILVNSQLETKGGRVVVGRLVEVKVDRRNHTIKAYIKDPRSLKKREIYIDTMERLYESNSFKAMSFSQFINS